MRTWRRRVYAAGDDGGAGGGGNGDGGQQGGAGDGGGTGDGDGGAQRPGWMDGLSDSLRNDAEIAKLAENTHLGRYKTTKSLINGLISARTDIAERPPKDAVVVPGEGATEEAVKKYREAVGIPEKADDYEINIAPPNDPARPEFMPTEAQAAVGAKLRELAHSMGLTKAQAKQFTDYLVQSSQENAQQSQVARAKAIEDSNAAMIERFGVNLETNLAKIQPAMAALQTADASLDIQAFLRETSMPGGVGNHPTMKRLLVAMGDLMKADRFVAGDGAPRGVDGPQLVQQDTGQPVFNYDAPGGEITLAGFLS